MKKFSYIDCILSLIAHTKALHSNKHQRNICLTSTALGVVTKPSHCKTFFSTVCARLNPHLHNSELCLIRGNTTRCRRSHKASGRVHGLFIWQLKRKEFVVSMYGFSIILITRNRLDHVMYFDYFYEENHQQAELFFINI